MRDGLEEDTAEPRRPRLTYPFEVTPEPGSGEAVEVAPGVLWLRQPLGGSLQFINVWALADGDGWALVDTGIQTHESAQAWRAAFKGALGGFGKAIYQLPDSYRRMEDGDTFEIGGRLWRVVTGNGHSPEHACLYCPELKLLISGDQVLPRISSNVSVFPTEPDADPLTDWITSCAKLKAAVPDEVLVLPAHNDPFHGLHARLDHLIGGHERSLGRLEKLLAKERKRAVDVFGALFARPIDGGLLGMATGESLAHINCLIHRGRAVREVDSDGVAWHRAV